MRKQFLKLECQSVHRFDAITGYFFRICLRMVGFASIQFVRWRTTVHTFAAIGFAFGALVMAGCSDRAASPVVGEWILEVEDADDLESRTRMVQAGDEGSVESAVVFESDGTLRTRFAQEFVGTWKKLSEDESQNVLTLNCELKGTKCQTRITFVDDDTIKMIPPNLIAIESEIDEMTFRRKVD